MHCLDPRRLCRTSPFVLNHLSQCNRPRDELARGRTRQQIAMYLSARCIASVMVRPMVRSISESDCLGAPCQERIQSGLKVYDQTDSALRLYLGYLVLRSRFCLFPHLRMAGEVAIWKRMMPRRDALSGRAMRARAARGPAERCTATSVRRFARTASGHLRRVRSVWRIRRRTGAAAGHRCLWTRASRPC